VSANAAQPISITSLETRPALVATLSPERRAIVLRVTRSLLEELGDWSELEALGDRTVARLRTLEAHLVRLTVPRPVAVRPPLPRDIFSALVEAWRQALVADVRACPAGAPRPASTLSEDAPGATPPTPIRAARARRARRSPLA
jgi:hypothetical protein